MFSRALIAPSRSMTISGVKALKFSRSSSFSGLAPKRRMETHAPSSASGGMIALKREPSSMRASTIGQVSSTRRPTFEMIRSMICIRWLLSRKVTLGLLHLAAALDVDVLRAVDEDVADRRVLQQHFQRPQAERLVEHLVDQPFALVAVQQRVFGVAEMLDDQADLAAEHVAFQFADPRQVELVDQLAVDPLLQGLEAAFLGLGRAEGGRRFHGRAVTNVDNDFLAKRWGGSSRRAATAADA